MTDRSHATLHATSRATFATGGLEALATAVVALNAEHRIAYVNPAAENLFKISQRHVLDVPLADAFPESPDLEGLVEQAQVRSASFTLHGLTVTPAGQPKVEVSCTASPLDTGGFSGFVLEFVELHQQLRMARDERMLDQSEANRALLRNLAHEIKNPLGGIRGAAQLLERELDRADLHEYTQVIMKEADRLQTLMDRLLANRRPKPAPMNIHEALERVRSLLTAEYPNGLRIRRDYDVSLPPLMADQEQIIQAVLNVTRNAAQALHGKGEIVIRTRVARQVTMARRLHRIAAMIQITDNGPGIAKDIQDKVFHPLFSGREDGTGLGLTIAQNYIQQHHGIIEVESEPGRTCFTLLLPFHASEPVPDITLATAKPAPG
ncbi:MAG: PAS domain-containing protein [Betaproteobacteria bacterium]|nr:PAS domain-containing protein [Betaproteobacteria bacterium]